MSKPTYIDRWSSEIADDAMDGLNDRYREYVSEYIYAFLEGDTLTDLWMALWHISTYDYIELAPQEDK